MAIHLDQVGGRLKAFRLASGLRPEEVAARVGISRAGLYRYENGQVAKIETLERFAEMYGVSVPTLLGIGVEYVASAVAFFERLRQLEAEADEIVAFFGPVSYLLTSEGYDNMLSAALAEGSVPEAEQVKAILQARKRAYRARRPRLRSLVAGTELERLAREGLVGAADVAEDDLARRREQAQAELAHLADLLATSPEGTQAGIVAGATPGLSFEILGGAGRPAVAISPFRLGAAPNVQAGVGLITAAPEAVALHRQVAADLWQRALKGDEAAAYVRELIARHAAPTTEPQRHRRTEKE